MSERGAPLLVRLLFGVVVVFTLIGTVETGFIIYDRLTGAFSFQRGPDLGLGVRSWTEHHAMRPGYSSPNVNTNSLGLRSPEPAIPKPAETVRILLLGDSFTFGLRVSDDQVFARHLEQLLRAARPGAAVDVVNAGVISYCPLLEYLQYRHHLHVLEPDLVVLNFDMSDVQDHMAYSRDLVSSPAGEPLYVTEPSLRKSPTSMPGLLSFEWFARRLRGVRGRAESTLQGVPFVRDQDRYLWTFDNGPAWDTEAQSTMAPIANLQSLLRQDGIPLLLATYPQPWQVSADSTPVPPIRDQYAVGQNTVHLNDRPFKKLEAFAAEHQIPFLNAAPAFRQDTAPAGLFLPNDFHFSPRGHEFYARLLGDYITAHALVPDRAQTKTQP